MTDYSCIQMAVSDICKCDYANLKYFSLCIFSIEYINKLNSEQIWKKLRPKHIVHFIRFYKEIFGIDIEEWQPGSDPWQNIADGLGRKKDILLGFDCYYAPWSPSYRQTHILHFCQVKGMEDGDKLICTDSYMDAFDVSWERKEFQKAYKSGYYVTAATCRKQTQNKEILLWIKEAVTEDSLKYHYGNLLKDLLQIENYSDLFETENPEACELIIMAKQISRNYGEAAKILKGWDIDISPDRMGKIQADYQRLCDNWNMITQLLLYMLLRRKIIRESIDSIRKHIEDNLACETEILRALDGISDLRQERRD